MWKDIAFGFVLSADQAAVWARNPFKAQDMVLAKAGVKPTVFTGDKEADDRNTAAYIAARDKALADCGCKLIACGNSVIAVSYEDGEEDTKAFKYVRPLDVAGLSAKGADSIPRLRAFCQMLAITYAEPQWLVVRQTARI